MEVKPVNKAIEHGNQLLHEWQNSWQLRSLLTFSGTRWFQRSDRVITVSTSVRPSHNELLRRFVLDSVRDNLQ